MAAAIAPLPAPLPRPYDTRPLAEAVRPSRAVVELVRGQVRALLTASPAYALLAPGRQQALERSLVKIAAYAAECVRDDWYHSARLGQRPLVRVRETVTAPVAQVVAAAPGAAGAVGAGRAATAPGTKPRAATLAFEPTAANQIARVTRETLNAIAFPTFVADLIRGTFDAIVRSSIQQLEAYGQLLENVSKTVDQFMAENISDNQARDWLAQRYPEHIAVQTDGGSPRAVPRDGADERPKPDFRAELGLPSDVGLDEDAIEEVLVPAARRRLAQSRLQTLATLVMMGMNRIVVTGGKIRAAMNFHIDTSDRAREQHATDFDARVATRGSFGYGPWSAEVAASVAYVSSQRSDSSSEINTDTNLSSEVELHFQSDYLPIERFADAGGIGRIRANTPVPETNAPHQPIPWGASADNQPAPSRRTADPLPALPAMPAMPGLGSQPGAPLSPDAVAPSLHPRSASGSGSTSGSSGAGTAGGTGGAAGSPGRTGSSTGTGGASGGSGGASPGSGSAGSSSGSATGGATGGTAGARPATGSGAGASTGGTGTARSGSGTAGSAAPAPGGGTPGGNAAAGNTATANTPAGTTPTAGARTPATAGAGA